MTATADSLTAPKVVETVSQHRRSPSSTGLVATLVIGLVWAWIPFLRSSLQIDESLTWWMIEDSFTESVRRPHNYQGQSPLYFMFLWVWTQVAGTSELALRLPTIIFTFATVWHMRRLGAELSGRVVGDLAASFYAVVAIATVSTPEGALWVVARPYSALFFALVVAARLGWRWAESGCLLHGAGMVVGCVLAIYMHPFAVFTVAAFGVWAIARMRERGGPQILTLGCFGALLLVPLVPQALSLRERGGTFSYGDSPSILLVPFAPVQVAVMVGVVVSYIAYRRLGSHTDLRPFALPFAAVWMVATPLGLYVQGLVTADSVFLFRYFAASVPAMCLLAAFFVARIDGTHAATLAVGGSLVAALASAGVVSTGGFERVAGRIAEQSEPRVVLATSPLVELRDASFIEGDAIGYLSAHLAYYGVSTDALLPRFEDAASMSYLEATFARAGQANRVVVVEPVRVAHPDGYYGEIARRRLGSLGFDRNSSEELEDHVVSVFVRRS